MPQRSPWHSHGLLGVSCGASEPAFVRPEKTIFPRFQPGLFGRRRAGKRPVDDALWLAGEGPKLPVEKLL